MKDKREYSFDVMRTIAKILVIIIHVTNVYCRSFGKISETSYAISLFFDTLARISVPIFFMISGSLLLERKFDKKKYIKRLLRFVLVIIVWDIIYLLWEYYYLNVKYDKLYLLLFNPYRKHLWFLYSILELYFLQPIIKIILDKSNKVIKVALLFLWIIFSIISLFNSSIANFFTIFIYIGYFVIGKYLYDYIKKVNLSKYNILFFLMIIISIAISTYLNYYYSLKFDMFYNKYFAYRAPFIIISSLSAFILLYNYFHNKKPNKVIMTLSDLSFGVYLVHGIFLDVSKNLVSYKDVNPLIGIPSFTIFILLCSLLVCYLIKKIKYLNKIM